MRESISDMSGFSVQDPGIFASAALRRVHHQTARLQSHARESSRHDHDLIAVVEAVRTQIDMASDYSPRGGVVRRNTRESDDRLRDVVSRVALDAVAEIFNGLAVGGRTNEHSVSARLTYCLHDQFGKMIEDVSKIS